ncbi:glutaredoxin [Nocardioides albertanoniae]|uniref:Glutaredoxin n=1 Tax=Nocardioides albertanoniae TaxID=1175486 RepID=A0A543ADK1_9ACTN|nr:glutaredoxin family protein [Nocardioides albertanoniae]TQL70664.1 glutaredoxin [Nocardioides albertanoniae]
MEPRVTFYSRQGCHLCDEARSVIESVVGDDYAEVDIDQDADLQERFTNEVPVTYVDGRQHDFWRVSEDRLRAALARPPE